MRVAMRQLLSRKKSGKLSEGDQEQEPPTSRPGTFLPPLDHMGERVFPIRNLRGNTEIPWLEANGQNGTFKHEGELAERQSLPGSYGSVRSSGNGKQTPSVSETISNPSSRDGNEHRKVSDRSQYIASRSGPPGVLPGTGAIDKGRSAYRRCEDEPIHIPGAVQNFGALLGMRYTDEGYLEVRIASENSRKILGYGPEDLFAMTSFLDALKNDGRDEMVARIRHALSNTESLKEETRLEIFQITLTFPYEPEIRLWCALHIALDPTNMVVCEFEEYVDAFYLKDLRAAKSLPDFPVPSMGFESSPEELKKSTTSSSKPLPVLEIARQRSIKEFSSLDLFNALAQAQKQVSNCKSVQELLEVAVGIISELTGFHRVMFYRFDSEKNGCVDAEMLNPQASKDVFRGLHYPASDIPNQARELYKINRIRILHDRGAETARLVCRDDYDYEHPLDLTHAYLRAMSPIHNKYLANMGVRSTMSISIVINGDLWGLIACHGYGDDGIRVSLPIRELCRNIGEYVAVNIKQLSMQQRLQARRPPLSNPTSKNPAGMLTTSSTDLLRLVDADFALLSIDEEARAIGRLDPYSEAIAIMSHLHSCKITEIRSSQNINADFPRINQQSGGIKNIAGLLIIPLNGGGVNDFLVFFRKSQLKHVKWAGNPYTKDKAKANGEYLEPRKSFQRWVETIEGTSIEWTEDQLDTAWILSLLYSRLIEVWRQRDTSNQGEKLSSIRNSSRELRTPINAVMNYIEMAMENTTDDRTRQMLGRAQEASSSLVHVMEDLLKLTKVEDVSPQQDDKFFNLSLTVSRVLKALQKEAQRKSLDLTVLIHESLPTMVKGDGDRLKQVLAYLAGNAFKQSTSAVFEINTIRTKDMTSVIGINIQDSSPGMSESELDDTFQEFEQAQDEDDWLFATEVPTLGANNGKKGKDSGLAIIARYVRSVDGQIRVTSEPGKGTVFHLELPFENAPNSDATVPRKLRNLFSPSHGSMKFPSPPSASPPMRSPKPHQNGSMKNLDIMVHPGSSRTSLQVENGQSMRGEPRNRAPSPYRPKSDSSSSLPDVDRDRSSFTHMHVLVAEDNFVSQRMLEKKLSQLGYTVTVAADGQEAHDRFVTTSSKIDVILMDMKMPLVDGALSARMIRFWEKESKHRTPSDSRDSITPKARVPIIAVATCLDDDSRFDYIQNGFDGWVIKPVDFRRLDLMLQGVKNTGMKRDSLYSPGQEEGGWFFP